MDSLVKRCVGVVFAGDFTVFLCSWLLLGGTVRSNSSFLAKIEGCKVRFLASACASTQLF